MRQKRRAARALAIAGCALALTLAACEEPQEQTEFVRPVRAMKIQDAETFVQRSFPGRAAATREINASFRVGGQLFKRPIDLGMEVKQGDLIAALDPATYQAEVDRTNAELASAIAVLDRADQELTRQSTLLEEGWVTEARVQTVQATQSAAQAAVIAARSAVARAELDLSYTTLTAPFDGVIVETYVENFQTVFPEQPIARIVDTSQIEFWISIPEGLISLAPYVREVTVEFDAFPGQALPAQIKEIKNEASQTTRTFDVNLIMDQPEGFTILPGMAGRASQGRLDLPEDLSVTGFEVPLAAIHNPSGDQDYVWVIDEETMAVSHREITVIEPAPRGMRVQNVAPGEWVVIAGVEYLREGQKVRFER
ncbi:MAG: efflux RND transporter periplasmic adaptor subunit [Alphaproteobacteria bacterium]|nr:efflux RND transporter periplasmic adaptor subunit [Alphaproteobacteria bacterium]